MSTVVLKSETSAPSSQFHSVLDWLRQVKVALSLPAPAALHLPDRYLDDINVSRRDVAGEIERGVERLGLLDLGWQQPRRPGGR